jgi:uncharacterized protein YdeI (YjbR/CyaY-like superfamily)
MSEILTEYLKRLEEQQESVKAMISEYRSARKAGKSAHLGNPRASLQKLTEAAAKVSAWRAFKLT